MEWWVVLLIILIALLALMASGLPTAFCFMVVNIGTAYIFWGGHIGLYQLILNMMASIMIFSIMPMVLFILMGSILFHAGLAPSMVEAMNRWLGRLPGRLSILAVMVGTLFASLTGSNLGSTAMLGSVMLPEMEKQGYKKPMILGPIMGAGGLAIMIPPSSLGVFIAVISGVSVGSLLIGIIIPGFLMAIAYLIYIFTACYLNPLLAPKYKVRGYSLLSKISFTVKYLLPFGVIIFLVTGVVFLGVATPTEAAATGALGGFMLAAIYKKMSWRLLSDSLKATLRTVTMVLFIMASAAAYSQVLSYSGATQGMIEFVLNLPLPRIVVVIGMQVLVLIMGCIMDPASIIMIVIPMFMPVVEALNFNSLWFVVVMLLNIEMAQITPPFGLVLFMMKGMASKETTMLEVYKAGIPFLLCDAVVMLLLLIFPTLVLWLPSLMR
jgi:tripartite ATP-independent transporter DctM subunit